MVDSSKFPPTSIFAREAYVKVLDYVMTPRRNGRKKAHIITGTPGIGKSMFMFYLIYRFFFCFDMVDGIVLNHLILLTSWGKFHIRRREEDGVVEWRKVRHEEEYDHLYDHSSKTCTETAVFWDPGNNKDVANSVQPTGAALEMVFASPNETRYLKFFDKHRTFKQRVYMPLWDGDELEHLRSALFDDRVSRELCDELARIYGHNPRLTLQHPAVAGDGDRSDLAFLREDLVEKIEDLKLEKLERLLKMKTISDDSRKESDKYYHIFLQLDVPRSTQTNEYLFRQKPTVRPASKFVEKELTFIFLSKKIENTKQSLKHFLASASGDDKSYAGWMFEWYAHYEVGKMRELACVSLGDNSTRTTFKSDWSGGREVFRKLDDIVGNIKPSTYYLPAYQTLPSIDSFVVLDDEDENGNNVRRALAFQMTVARNHNVKRQGLEALQSLLNSGHKKPEEFHLIFVTPVHDDESRTMTTIQKLLNKNDTVSKKQKSTFSQWRLDVPLNDLRLMKSNKYDPSASN